MLDRDYSTSTDFLSRFFGEASQAIELRACSNDRSGGAVPIFGRQNDVFQSFCRKRDQPGTGIFFGICTRRQGVTRGTKETVAECPALWVDIDCAKQGISGDAAIQALDYLPFPPTLIVNSGGGLHAYWMLEEAIDVSPGQAARETIERALRQLALILAGDTACAELARILRLPGTSNSKPATLQLNDGQSAIVEIISDNGRVHDLEQLCEWLDDQRPVLQGVAASPKPVRADDPFTAYARAAGYEPAIDIDAELAAMSHGAVGGASIHETQLRVSMSMVARGYDDDEIVGRILSATEAAAPRDEHWNWTREERELRRMIQDGRRKVMDRSERAAPRPQAAGNTALKLVHDADAEERPTAKPSAKPQKEAKSATVAVGKAVVGVWQDRYGPVIHTNGTTYAYEGGVWTAWNERLAQRLRAIIQEACASIGLEPKTSLLGAAKAYFMDRPELIRNEVEFDAHGLLVANDACLDLATFKVIPHSPDHYAIRKTAATLSGDRGRTVLDSFLTEAFSDNPDAAEIISTLQEWFGAAIMPLPSKQRGQKKGLFAHGPSRTGKTQITELARFLLGHDNCCGARVSDLEDRFGTEPLIGRYGWIADDAVGEGDFLNADIYKVVVTGERTSTKTKGGKNWEGRFGIPVLHSANNLFRVKDQSDAVYNRLLIVHMTNVRPESAPEPVGFESIADQIGRTELTGLLWWAIEGWQRLARRGVFDPPASMLEAGKALKDDNNPVDAWRRECLDLVPDSKVLRADLLASMNGWSAQEYGAESKPWAGRGFFPRLTKMLPGYSKERSETADVDGNRLLVGVQINQAGLLAWRTWKDSRHSDTTHTSSTEDAVNRDHAPGRMSLSQLSESRRPRF